MADVKENCEFINSLWNLCTTKNYNLWPKCLAINWFIPLNSGYISEEDPCMMFIDCGIKSLMVLIRFVMTEESVTLGFD